MLLVWVSLVLIWAGGGRHGFSCCFDVDLVLLDFRVEGSSYLWLDLSELFVSFWLILKAFLLDSGCFGLLCILTLSCHEKKEITSSIVGGSVCCWWRWLYQLDLESERLMFVSHLDYYLFFLCCDPYTILFSVCTSIVWLVCIYLLKLNFLFSTPPPPPKYKTNYFCY